MNYINNFIRRIFNLYNLNDGSYQQETAQANVNTAGGNYTFNGNLPPYFYSGQLFIFDGKTYRINPNLKMLFLTMNPQENEHVHNWFPGTVPFEGFIERMNNWFVSEEATERRYSNVYGNCQAFLKMYLNANDFNGRYTLLHDNAVALDWFPFYSPSFKLNNHWNNIPEENLQNILSLFNDSDNKIPFIAIGGAARQALSQLGVVTPLSPDVVKIEIDGQVIYCVPKLAVPGVGRGDVLLSSVVATIQRDMGE